MNQQHVSTLEGFLSNVRSLGFGDPYSDLKFLTAPEGIPCRLSVSGDSGALCLSPRSSMDDGAEDDWDEDEDDDDDDWEDDEDDGAEDDWDEDDDEDDDDWDDDDYEDDEEDDEDED